MVGEKEEEAGRERFDDVHGQGVRASPVGDGVIDQCK